MSCKSTMRAAYAANSLLEWKLLLLRLMVTWMFAIYLDLTVYAVAFQTWCDIQRV